MQTESDTQLWLRIAAELQELSKLLSVESTKLESGQLRQKYKQRLLALKEQALRNGLMD